MAGGYVDAMSAWSQNQARDAELENVRQAIAFSKLKFDLEQQQRERLERSHAAAVETYPQLTAPPEGPQSPSPGQASVPMSPPQGQVPPPMAPGMGGGMASLFGPPSAGGLQPPPGSPSPQPLNMGAIAGQPPLGMPPQPAGWRPSPAAPPSLGGPPGGTAGPGMPGSLAPPPDRHAAALAEISNQPDWAANAIKKLTAKGLTPNEIYNTLEAMAPLRDAHNKEVISTYRIEKLSAEAGERAAKAEKERLEAELGKPAKTTGEVQNAIFSAGGDPTKPFDKQTPEVMARARKLVEAQEMRKGRTTINVGALDSGLSADAKTLAAEQYLATGQLPPLYRDAKSRAAIIDLAAQLQKSRGGELSDVPGARGGFKADVSSLTQLTRRSDALEQSSKKINKDITTMMSVLDKGNFGSVTAINTPINKLRTMMSDPDLGKLELAAKIVGTEYERMINGGLLSIAQLHEGAREDAQRILNGNMSVKEIKAKVPLMRQEIDNQRSAFTEQLSDVRGRMKGGAGAGGAAASKGLENAPAPTNGKGWKLMVDKNGNKAYVSPDKTQFEAVQ